MKLHLPILLIAFCGCASPKPRMPIAVAVDAATVYWNETIYLSSGTTITSLTVSLPSSSTVIGQIYRIHSKSAITTLAVTGGSFADAAVTNLTDGQTIAYQAQSTSGAYIRIQ